jgi:site-specific recombinase XerD
MPGLHRKKKHYYGVFYGPDRRPRQKWIALRTTNRKAATAKLRELEVLQAVGEFDPWNDAAPRDSVPVSDAIDAFMKARLREDLQPATLRADRTALTRLTRTLDETRPVSSVSQKELAAFFTELREEGARETTLQAYHTRLKLFFDWCRETGLVRENPIDGLKRPRRSKTSVRFLTEEEAERLLQSVRTSGRDAWLEDVIEVAIGTGMRLSELCAMRRDWISLSPPSVTVKRSSTYRPKNHSERHIPLAGSAREVVQRLHASRSRASDRIFLDGRGRALKPNRVSKAFKWHVRRAGLSEEYTFHTLRHTYASWLVGAGTDLYRVRDLLGHQSIEVTERYAHLKPEDLRRAVESTFAATFAAA